MVVLYAPESFQAEMARLGAVVATDLQSVAEAPFVLAFVTSQSEVDQRTAEIVPHAKGDAMVWMAYPKGTSKRYTCDFQRDTGWAELQKAGFATVRAIAIDEDWTALRFRRAEYVGKSQATRQS